jgi:hypothetical protein
VHSAELHVSTFGWVRCEMLFWKITPLKKYVVTETSKALPCTKQCRLSYQTAKSAHAFELYVILKKRQHK